MMPCSASGLCQQEGRSALMPVQGLQNCEPNELFFVKLALLWYFLL
jgi:hypothetical protein